MFQRLTSGQCGGQYGDYGIAGTGNIVNLTCPRWQVERFLPALDQGHAFFAAGHQNGLQVVITDQFPGLGNQGVIVCGRANHGFKLAQIRRDQGSAAVALKVGAFGIDQNRYRNFPRGTDQILRIAQRAFAVVGQNHDVGGGQTLIEVGVQIAEIGSVEGFFKVEADQLLVAAHNP